MGVLAVTQCLFQKLQQRDRQNFMSLDLFGQSILDH